MTSIRRGSSSGLSHATAETSESHSTYSTYQTSTSSRSNKYCEDEYHYKYAPSRDASEADISPSTSRHPRDSVDTYISDLSEEENDDDTKESFSDEDALAIPILPEYRAEVSEPYVRPSNPSDFAKLFPSLNRFSIRHDEYTADGNLNLRVDTTVNAPGHRRLSIQLFHLRMYDLAKREFSLRRYCRDSGREVCNSKRKYHESGTTSEGRPTLHRSISTVFKSLGNRPQFRRRSSVANSLNPRPETSSSNGECDTVAFSTFGEGSIDPNMTNPYHRPVQSPRPIATNSIKLEFSNYARVDVTRRGTSGGRGKKSSKRYEFSWWGHDYTWKRHCDKTLGTVSYHLIRDSDISRPVAHIVPEIRTPSQVHADEMAGGWVPPCHMWISDESVLETMTDVAE